MYGKVFISHSRDDPNLDYFHQLFSGIRTAAIWMEFEDITPPPWEVIREKVNQSNALFLLLSIPLQNLPHTRNWVSFELGLAANYKKTFSLLAQPEGLDVYVFEPADILVDFPVPYCTYYMLYRADIDELKFLKEMIQYAPLHNKGVLLTCPYSDCQLSFKLLTDTNEIYCPACRRRIPL